MADELATITGTIYLNTADDPDRVPWPDGLVRAVPVLLDETAAIADSRTIRSALTDSAGLVTLHLWPGAWRIILPDGEVIDGDGSGVVVEAGESYTLLGLRGYVAPPGTSVTTVALSSLAATTLAAGEDATVEVEGDGLVLGIPRGADGAHTYASLDDVDLTGLADGDAMVWDATSERWVRVSLSSTYATKDELAAVGGAFVVDDTPAAPAEGTSATYFVTSSVSWPAGLEWSTDPDGGVAPTITGTALVSLFTYGGTTRAVLGATFPALPDTEAPTVPANLTATAVSSTAIDLAWDASADNVAVTGYEYRIDGGAAVDAGAGTTEAVTGLTAATEYDFEVRAYDAASNYSAWSTVATETTDTASDVTAPTVGTLAGSAITETSFTLTITGAADETALHATPYDFSLDDGATWFGYQAAATYNASGLTAGTAYTCKHRVRDAALNVSTGTAITVNTSAASTILASDTFNRANGALGTSDGPGSVVWPALGSGYVFTVIDNTAKCAATPAVIYRSVLDAGQANHKATAKVLTGGPQGIVARSDADGLNYYRLIFSGGTWYIVHVANNTTSTVRHQWPRANPAAGDTMGIQAVTNGSNIDFTVYHNGTSVKTYSETNPTYVLTGTHVGIWASSGSLAFDDFVAEAV